MQGHAGQSGQMIQYAVTAVIVLVVLAIRMRGMSRMRRLRLETLWIVPAIYLVFAGTMYYEFPPTGLAWLMCAAGLAVGGGIGWQRGKLMQIHVDPETHTLNQKASPAAFVFIALLVLFRFGARSMMEAGGSYGTHVNTMLITDVLIAFALGLFASTRLEMYIRAKRLLDEARAARA